MTELTFLSLCGELGINPNVAIENKKLEKALLSRDDLKVMSILANEF